MNSLREWMLSSVHQDWCIWTVKAERTNSCTIELISLEDSFQIWFINQLIVVFFFLVWIKWWFNKISLYNVFLLDDYLNHNYKCLALLRFTFSLLLSATSRFMLMCINDIKHFSLVNVLLKLFIARHSDWYLLFFSVFICGRLMTFKNNNIISKNNVERRQAIVWIEVF